MTERPKKINVEEVLMGRKSDNYRDGWNACCDQYEAWEKKNTRLERLDEQWLKTQIDNFFPAFEGELGAHNKAQLRKCILEKLNQPKDAVSVPTVEEINKVLLESPRHKYNYETKEYDTQAKAIHDLITRKLKGQDNEAK